MLRSPDTQVSISDIPAEYIQSPSLAGSIKKKRKSRESKKVSKKLLQEGMLLGSSATPKDLDSQIHNEYHALYSAAPLRSKFTIAAAHYFDSSESAPHPTWIGISKNTRLRPIQTGLDASSSLFMDEITSEQITSNPLNSLSALSAAAVVMAKIESSSDFSRLVRSESGSTSTETVDYSSSVPSPVSMPANLVSNSCSFRSANTSPTATDQDSVSPVGEDFCL